MVTKQTKTLSPQVKLLNIAVDFGTKAATVELEILPAPPFPGATGRASIADLTLPANSVVANPGTRQIAITGERPLQETEGRVYQQLEIPSGPFRRVVELQVEVDADRASATYEDGILRIELPLRDPGETTRRVPIGRGG